jgi:translation initiation factor IF-1
MQLTRRLAVIGLAFSPGLALAQQPQGAVVATTSERTAIVETVNMAERSVLLRGDAGAQSGVLATVCLGPQVRNLARIRPGDRVVISVTDAIAASFARPDGRAPVAAAEAVTPAPLGARPGVAHTDAVRMRVRVEGIDLGRNSVAFVRPDGTRREVRVEDPRMRAFVRTLSPGDQVDVVFLEIVALRVLPPG